MLLSAFDLVFNTLQNSFSVLKLLVYGLMLYDFSFLGKVFTLIIWINIAGKKVQTLKRAFQE